MDIREYQRKAFKTNVVTDKDIYLLGLVGEVGSVFSAFKKIERDTNNDSAARRELSEEVGDVLWYLAAVASSLNISLAKAAEYNLEKTHNYFIGKSRKYFDSEFPKSQQLPRKMVVQFKPAGAGQVRIAVDGDMIGDELDDNVMTPDGYRYHDVFHLAYAAHLRWSPVWRHLIRAKRHSDKYLRRVQDGARARIVEEAVAAMLFAEHKKSGLGFEDPNEIPFSILEIAKRMTDDFEVRTRTINEWRGAISDGFKMFRLLRANKGGFVTANLARGTLSFRRPRSLING
jgi:NTP pyrophosphatase (non-canonical NTP hydrolase)